MALTTHDLLTNDERRRLASLLVAGLSCSRHSLTGGDRDRWYLNMDKVLSDPSRSKQLIELLVAGIRNVTNERKVDLLAFVDNSARGPSALLTCKVALEEATGLRGIIVRPDKRLHVSQLTGEATSWQRVLFLCDVLTTGQTMARAAAICARRQLNIVGAIYVFDRMLHGQADLEAAGIEISILTSLNHFLSDLIEQLAPEQVEALKHEEAPERHDLFRLMAMQL